MSFRIEELDNERPIGDCQRFITLQRIGERKMSLAETFLTSFL